MAGWMPFFALAGLFAAYFGFQTASNLTAAFGQIVFFLCIVALLVSTVLASTRRVNG